MPLLEPGRLATLTVPVASSGAHRGGLQLSPQKDGQAFVAFLNHLVATLPPGPLVIVLDNVGYRKGRLAKDWWMAHNDQVRPLWLPPYAPQFNLLERVWGYVKDELSCHRWWADGPALESATTRLLSQLQARFHQPDPGGIFLVHAFWEAAWATSAHSSPSVGSR